jgi:hypothetical protein
MNAVAQAGPSTRIVGIDATRCGVVAMSVPPDDIDNPPLPPIWDDPCQEQMNQCFLTSLASKFGKKSGENRCVECARVCRQNGYVWPLSYRTYNGGRRSCNYMTLWKR